MADLYELIYTSVTPEPLTEEAVFDLLSDARERNKANRITGLLYYDGQRFLQIIEGLERNIARLYHSIQHDKRHQDVERLHAHSISKRAFENWSMAYERLSDEMGDGVDDHIALINFEMLDARDPSTNLTMGARLFDLFVKTERATACSPSRSNA